MSTEWDSEWDRLEAVEKGQQALNNVVPISDDMPDWMNDMDRYGEQEKPVEPLDLIDPSAWSSIEPPARRWKVKDYIPHGQATLLTGKGAAGKSLVSQLKATCIAMGLPFLGLEVEQANALYITCEDDRDELQRRQVAICEGLGITFESLSGKLHLLSLQGELSNELATFAPDGRMSVAPRYRQIQDACARHEIGFLTLDNTAHLFTGNENDRHQVASFINLCNRLATAIDGAVVIVGHPNKAGDSYSGSTAWENQVRSRLFMEIPASENGEIVDPDQRVMRREKVNYAQRGGELRFMWFKGSFVLPEVVEKAEADLGQAAADAKDNSIFLACLKERNKQKRAVSEQKRAGNYAPKEFAEMPESRGIGRARLERAMDRLYRISAIERGFLWVHKGEGKAAHGLRISAPSQGPKASDNISDNINVNKGPIGKSNEIRPIGSSTDVIGKSNEIKPIGSEAVSDNIADLVEPIGKSNNINPIGSPIGSNGEPIGKSNVYNPITSDFTPSLYEGGMGEPTLEEGGSPITSEEPPAWMDEAPPIEPEAWRENPILNPDWPDGSPTPHPRREG